MHVRADHANRDTIHAYRAIQHMMHLSVSASNEPQLNGAVGKEMVEEVDAHGQRKQIEPADTQYESAGTQSSGRETVASTQQQKNKSIAFATFNESSVEPESA